MLFTANAIVMIEQDVHDTDMMLEMFKEELISEFLDGEKWKEFSSPREYGQDLLNTLMDNKPTTKRKRNTKNFTLGKVKNMEDNEEEEIEILRDMEEELDKYSVRELYEFAYLYDINIPKGLNKKDKIKYILKILG